MTSSAAAAGNPRVYDENKQPAIGSAALPSYKWDAQSYQGFWYDLKNGKWSETLSIGLAPGNALTTTIDHNKRTIPEKGSGEKSVGNLKKFW